MKKGRNRMNLQRSSGKQYDTAFRLSAEKKDLNLTLVLQNGQELESYYEERLLPDTFPCAIGNMAAYCSIVIQSELISRLHACIYREDGAFYLEDMNSTNGTFLNGRRLLPKERQLLSDGDMVGFANLLYKVEKASIYAIFSIVVLHLKAVT